MPAAHPIVAACDTPAPAATPPDDHASRHVRRSLSGLLLLGLSACLRLPWQLDATVIIDADVDAGDRVAAAVLFERHLLQTRLAAYCPAHGPTGWRSVEGASLTRLRDVTVGSGTGMPWKVNALATVRITLRTRDISGDMYLEIEPGSPARGPVRRTLVTIRAVTRIRVCLRCR